MDRNNVPIFCESHSEGSLGTAGGRLAIRMRRQHVLATFKRTINIFPDTCLYSARPFVFCNMACTYVSSINFRNICRFFPSICNIVSEWSSTLSCLWIHSFISWAEIRGLVVSKIYTIVFRTAMAVTNVSFLRLGTAPPHVNTALHQLQLSLHSARKNYNNHCTTFMFECSM